MRAQPHLAIATALVAAGLAACATPQSYPEDFGTSVREMIRAQTAYPDHSPPTAAQRALSGDQAEAAMRVYRGEGGRSGASPDGAAMPMPMPTMEP